MTRSDSEIDTRSAMPLPTDVQAGPATTPAEEADIPPSVTRYGSGNEIYGAVVLRVFRV